MWMNGWEIDSMVERHRNHKVLARATRLLANLRDETNNNSDGWHSWPLPGRAASKLMELIQSGDASEVEYKRALAPIKAFYTRRGNAAAMKWPDDSAEPKGMKFILEIELDDMANPALVVAELLNMLHNELREDGITPGAHYINTRPYYRQANDGESTELVSNTVGKWEVVEVAR